MARTRRTWEQGLDEIRYLLREPEAYVGTNTHWTDTELRYLFNHERSLLEMALNQSYQGWNTSTRYATLTSGQVKYLLDDDMARLHRVVAVTTDGSEIPLEYDERFNSARGGPSSSVTSEIPTQFYLKGAYLYLYPTPSITVTSGIKMEFDMLQEPVTDTSNYMIPAGWPLFTEELLIYSTAIAAFDVEGAQGPEPQGQLSSLSSARDRYMTLWDEFIRQRNNAPTFYPPYLGVSAVNYFCRWATTISASSSRV